jgi:hypothetical protein
MNSQERVESQPRRRWFAGFAGVVCVSDADLIEVPDPPEYEKPLVTAKLVVIYAASAASVAVASAAAASAASAGYCAASAASVDCAAGPRRT